MDGDGGGQLEQGFSIGPGVGGDALERALLEQVLLVVERRDLREMDAGDGEGRASIQHLQCRRHELPGRREQDGAIQEMRRAIEAVPDPGRAELLGELAMRASTAEDEDLAAEVPGHLEGDVGGASEAEEPQAPPGSDAGAQIRAIPDDPRAQQRRELDGGPGLRQRVGEGFGHHGALRIAAILVPAGEAGLETEVLGAAQAEATAPARGTQPGDPHPRSDGEAGAARTDREHPTHDLVAGNHLRAVGRQLAFDEVQIGAAHAASLDLESAARPLPARGRGAPGAEGDGWRSGPASRAPSRA